MNVRARVTLLNDSTIRGDFNFKTKGETSFLTYLKNAQPTKFKFKPSDTKEVLIYMGKRWVKGLSVDSCWLFHIIDGRIDGFSVVPTASGGYNRVVVIRKGESGSQELFDQPNLLEMVEDNFESKKLALAGKLIKAMKLYNSMK